MPKSGGKATASEKESARGKARSTCAQLAQQRSLEGLQLMRARGLSLAQASAHAGTTPRTMQRHVGRALKKRDDGRFAATKWDRIPRTMRFLTETALSTSFSAIRARPVNSRGICAPVDRFLKTGDRGPLAAFRGKSIRAAKTAYAYVDNPNTLERLAYAGEVSFEDLYALTTGETK